MTYDLRDSADDLWGLGVGCNGLLRVFLQPLLPANGYEPFAAIAERLAGTRTAGLATVIESDRPDLSVGATAVIAETTAASLRRRRRCRRDPSLRGALEHADRRRAARGRAGLPASSARPCIPFRECSCSAAGSTPIPLVGMADELGWFVTVADHRPGYLARGGFERAERVVLVEPGKLAAALRLGDFDAIVVMSHHLATDRKYLAELAAVDARYLGVLGPRARRDRLLAELADAAPQLKQRLKGPVGLDIGADSPESIALSILAELQSTLSTR